MSDIKFVTDGFLSQVGHDLYDIRSERTEIHKNRVVIVNADKYESKDEQIKILKEALEFYRENSEKSTHKSEYFIDDYVSDLRAIEALGQIEEMSNED